MTMVNDNDLQPDFGIMVSSASFLTRAYLAEGRLRDALELITPFNRILYLPECSLTIAADIRTSQAWAQGWWAICVDHRTFPAAVAAAEMAIIAAEEGGDSEIMANALEVRAFLAYESVKCEVGGVLESAKGDIGTAIYLWKKQGLTGKTLSGEVLLGNICILQNKVKEAEELFRSVYGVSNDDEVGGHALCGLAFIAELQGNFSESKALLTTAAQLYRDNFNQLYLPPVYCQLGCLAIKSQDIEVARELLNEAWKLSVTVGNQRVQAEVQAALAEISEQVIDEKLARIHWQQAFEHATSIGSHQLIGRYLNKLQIIGISQKIQRSDS